MDMIEIHPGDLIEYYSQDGLKQTMRVDRIGLDPRYVVGQGRVLSRYRVTQVLEHAE